MLAVVWSDDDVYDCVLTVSGGRRLVALFATFLSGCIPVDEVVVAGIQFLAIQSTIQPTAAFLVFVVILKVYAVPSWLDWDWRTTAVTDLSISLSLRVFVCMFVCVCVCTI